MLAPYLTNDPYGKIYKDPAAVGEIDPRYPPNEVMGYGMNVNWIDVYSGPTTSFSDNKNYNPSIVNEPSKEVVYCDNRGAWSVGPLLDIYDPALYCVNIWGNGGTDIHDARRPRMAPRHRQSPNVTFLDLHAEHVGGLAKQWSEYWSDRRWWGPPSCWMPNWD